jgi:replicative DNA helicase
MSDVADETNTTIFEAARWQVAEGDQAPTGTKNLIVDALTMVEDRARSHATITGVPTGFSVLDRITAGLQPETLTVAAGIAGVGKSAFLMTIGRHAATVHHIPVLYFSMESSKFELMERMLAAEAQMDSMKLRTGRLEYQDWKGGVYPAATRLSEAPFAIADDPSPTLPSLERQLEQFLGGTESTPGTRSRALVLVDGLHAILPPARGDTQEREIADVVRSLKGLCRKQRVPMIATSSLNRKFVDREDKRPILSDLRGSGVIEDVADLLLFIHRPEMFSRDPDDREHVDLILAKNRLGPTGSVPLTFIREYCLFTDREVIDDGELF